MMSSHLPHWTFFSHCFAISFLIIDYSLTSNCVDSKRSNGLGKSAFIPMHATQAISIELLQKTSNSIELSVKSLYNPREFLTSSIVSNIGHNIF